MMICVFIRHLDKPVSSRHVDDPLGGDISFTGHE